LELSVVTQNECMDTHIHTYMHAIRLAVIDCICMYVCVKGDHINVCMYVCALHTQHTYTITQVDAP